MWVHTNLLRKKINARSLDFDFASASCSLWRQRHWWWFVVACSRVSWRDFNLQDTLSFYGSFVYAAYTALPRLRGHHFIHNSGCFIHFWVFLTEEHARSLEESNASTSNNRLIISSIYRGRGPEKVFGTITRYRLSQYEHTDSQYKYLYSQ